MLTLFLYKDTEVLLSYGNKKKPHFSIGPYSEFRIELPRRTSLQDVDAILYRLRHDFKRAKRVVTPRSISYGKYNLHIEECSVPTMRLSSDGNVLQIPEGTPIAKAFFYILHLSGELKQHCFFTKGNKRFEIQFKEIEKISCELSPEKKPIVSAPFSASLEEIQREATAFFINSAMTPTFEALLMLGTAMEKLEKISKRIGQIDSDGDLLRERAEKLLGERHISLELRLEIADLLSKNITQMQAFRETSNLFCSKENYMKNVLDTLTEKPRKTGKQSVLDEIISQSSKMAEHAASLKEIGELHSKMAIQIEELEQHQALLRQKLDQGEAQQQSFTPQKSEQKEEVQKSSEAKAQKPHYERPLIAVSSTGETTVYMPTEDAQAEQAFLEKHQKRVQDILSFLHEHYTMSPSGEEPIALLFDDADDIILQHKKNMKQLGFKRIACKKIGLSIPLHATLSEAITPLIPQLDKICQTLDKMNPYDNQESIRVWGKEYKLKSQISTERPFVKINGDTVDVHLQDKEQNITESIYSWYGAILQAQVTNTLDEVEEKLNISVRIYKASLMKTRWATYSTKTQTLNMNVLLAKYPLRCLRGVVIHVLLHTLIKEHTPEFYRILEGFCPDWKEIDAELKADTTTMTY